MSAMASPFGDRAEAIHAKAFFSIGGRDRRAHLEVSRGPNHRRAACGITFESARSSSTTIGSALLRKHAICQNCVKLAGAAERAQ